MATMLPKRKLLKLAALRTKPDKTPASPTPADRMMAMDISAYRGSFFRMASIPKAAATQAAVAPSTGLILKSNPAATPAREVWDKASPIMDNRLSTMTIPTQGMISARRMPTKKARCMKGYSKMDTAVPPSLPRHI